MTNIPRGSRFSGKQWMVVGNLLVLLLVLLSSNAWARPRHVHLSWESDPTQSVTVAWRTDSVEPSVVEYGVDRSYGLTASGSPGEVHEVELLGLSPSTLYHYRCGHPRSWSEDLNFTTAPSGSADRFSFAVVGDDRSGYQVRRSISLAILESQASFVLHTGDLVSTGREQSQWDSWFEDHRELLSHKVLMPAIGNHDENAPEYFEQFALPGNEQWYSFDYGNAHFVALTTEYQLTGSQLDWLKEDLASTNATWKFVYFHRPMYSSGYHGSDLGVRRAWENVLNRHHVDVVFCGHNHMYERTLPVRDGKVVDADLGTIHLTTAGGGAGLHSVTSPRPSWSQVALSEHHYALLDVKGGMLHCQAQLPSGTVFDEFELNKKPFPDLEAVSLSTDPSYPRPGGKCTISTQVRNNGQLKSKNFTVMFLLDGTPRSEVPLKGLEPGQETSIGLEWTPAREGAVDIEVIVDDPNQVDEGLKENNNRISIQTIVSRPRPDLAVTQLGCEGMPVQPGERTTLRAALTNHGNDPSGPFKVDLALKGAGLEHTAVVQGLEPGEVKEVQMNWTAQRGDWRLKLAADSANEVDELREENNEREETIHCRELAKVGPVYIPRGLPDRGSTVIYYNASEGTIGIESNHCFLVWGINGWQKPPKDLAGPGTLALSRFFVDEMKRVNEDLWFAPLNSSPEVGWMDIKFSDHALFPQTLDDNAGTSWQIPGYPWAENRLNEFLLAIEDAEMIGIDVSLFKDLAQSAEQCLLEGDYVGLNRTIGNATRKIREKESTVLLDKAATQYEKALEEGIDIGRARIYLEAGDRQLKKGHYSECKRLSQQVLEMIADARAEINETPLTTVTLTIALLFYISRHLKTVPSGIRKPREINDM